MSLSREGGSKLGVGPKDASSHGGPSYQVSRSGVLYNLRNYDFSKIMRPVMSHLSAGWSYLPSLVKNGFLYVEILTFSC